LSYGTTNQLLGYPADARLLIINADDYGICHAVNEAIIDTIDNGLVASTSLMTTCPWAPHAMQLLADRPEQPFGVHLTLVNDFAPYRWGPRASRDRVPSLVDESGYFYRYERIPNLLALAKLDELEIEFRAQIETVLTAGLRPTHLDWHCLADGGRPDIFDLSFNLAREYGLALRTHYQEHADRCQRAGLPSNDHSVLDSYHLDPAEKPARYAQLLRELPAGLTEWAVHPSLGNAEAQTLEPETWQVRRADYDVFISQAVRDVIDEEGIILLDQRALQPLWSPR
jgi:predicted glycoside hydrolase/deacetylase ChbG (UPF0249 family)